MNYIIYAGNLHFGGGVQVACSTIMDLSMNKLFSSKVHLIISDKVFFNLEKYNIDFSVFFKVQIVNHFGFTALFKFKPYVFYKHSIFFVIFGPFYSIKKPKNFIMGFANPWIFNRDNDVYRSFTFYQKIFTTIKLEIQSLFFSRANLFIVEDEFVKKRLHNISLFKNKNIKVVPNTISNVFLNPNKWRKINFDFSDYDDKIKIGFLGRNYPHKNVKILPLVKNVLNLKYNFNCHFFVTFSDNEWFSTDVKFQNNIINVGELTLLQCPSFYRSMDAIVFPSLLECFSVTPLEALYMKKPLFASDRFFIREFCKDFPIYFDPLNPEELADSIYNYFNGIDFRLNLSYQKRFIEEYMYDFNRTEEYCKILLKFPLDHEN